MTGIIFFSLTASFLIAKYGMKSRAIPIIKASNFQSPDYLAMYINRQLYQRLKTSSPIIFGYNKNDAYEKEIVKRTIGYISEDLKGHNPEIIELGADESFMGSGSSQIEEIKKRYNREDILSFTLVNLKGVAETSEIVDCEKDHTYSVWIACMKKQKLREILRAKKVKFDEPIAVVETQSQIDIMVYIRE